VTVRRALLFGLPLAAIVALVAMMANGPLYRTLSFEGCRKAYARALDRDDTARVDLRKFRPERDNRQGVHRCGEIRAVVATDSVPLQPLDSGAHRP
jgi:hypothetical protein